MSVKTLPVSQEQVNTSASESKEKASKPNKAHELPSLKDFLKAGVQFGHEARRWNPKMRDYIFTKKNDIHIIDLSKTLPLLQVAADFLEKKATEGPILYLGTKRQAADIVIQGALTAEVHFVANRWAGGLLSNFDQVQKSLAKLIDLEKQFEEGVAGRTKYEISLMKKDWERLNRLYGGIKNLKSRPVAVFVVDPVFERGAIRECNYLDIPVVAMTDTNSDPTIIDYPIPSNDDAIGSIGLIVNYISERLATVKSNYKSKYVFKDYSKIEVTIKKSEIVNTSDNVGEAVVVVNVEGQAKNQFIKPVKQESKPSKQTTKETRDKKTNAPMSSGILGKYQEKKEQQVKKSQNPRK